MKLLLLQSEIIGRGAYVIIQLDISMYVSMFVHWFNPIKHLKTDLYGSFNSELLPITLKHELLNVWAQELSDDEKRIVRGIEATIKKF